MESELFVHDAWSAAQINSLLAQPFNHIIYATDELNQRLVGYCFYSHIFEDSEILRIGTIVANENNKTTGFIYDGATVENEIDFNLKDETSIQLSLLTNSAKNADLIETKINEKFGKKLATALDTRTIEVVKPSNISMVKFLSLVQNIELDSTFKKKVIIDINRESVITDGNIVTGKQIGRAHV